ncbi:MAG: ATP-binding protein [Acidobacteriaceae bacterium]|nr:ATP-binding protein [Acidobacteriaceae bacterium]MBV9778568.1 ATP-binding protein [Acidobacteriaceae bacterium]
MLTTDSVDPTGLSVNIVPGESESLRQLLSELKRIDTLIQVEVRKFRQQHKADEQFQGLFIADGEVDALLERPPCSPRFSPTSVERGVRARDQAPETRLAQLARLFELTAFELDCLLICLAPELDPRYERLYAYLQDDVTKRRPSVDLVLNLLSSSIEEKLSNRGHFIHTAPLIRNSLLHIFEDPSQPHPTRLSKYLRIDERIVDYLLHSDELDSRLLSYSTCQRPKTELDSLVLASDIKNRVRSLARRRTGEPSLIVYLQGAYGSGKRATAEALCRDLNLRLLTITGKRLTGHSDSEFQTLLPLFMREALLQSAALYLADFDGFLAEDKAGRLAILLRELDARQGISFLAGESAWGPRDELANARFIRLEIPKPTYTERLRLWQRAVESTCEFDLSLLSTKFRFTAGQIRDAAATARNLASWRDPESSEVTMADLYEACRLQCNRKLSLLARKIKPHYSWNDIVLPLDRVEQLKEICNAVKFRSVIYDQWGFDRKLSLGKGLNILFAGPPGTGKTMAAEIMAGELGLDLYKTDLSTVVSKYIGETEKNLARIFAEAENSNAILFFDEADALFGKRSEVRDSHDRYANIEINYLLQKMEEHEGLVILATNFRKNMDDAFVRRLHYTLDFPFPDEAERHRIWQSIWPKETPRHVELDLQALARRFELAGGSIRNIALGAAFLAADNGGIVKMQHLLHATRREYQKMGKVVSCGEFE